MNDGGVVLHPDRPVLVPARVVMTASSLPYWSGFLKDLMAELAHEFVQDRFFGLDEESPRDDEDGSQRFDYQRLTVGALINDVPVQCRYERLSFNYSRSLTRVLLEVATHDFGALTELLRALDIAPIDPSVEALGSVYLWVQPPTLEKPWPHCAPAVVVHLVEKDSTAEALGAMYMLESAWS